MYGKPEIVMKRLLILLALTGGLFAAGPMVSPADACPMCKYANEDGSEDGAASSDANRRPKAYMYSILFMISMPATLLAGFSFSFYRMWKKQHELAQMSLDGPLEV
jgi:hypothetical protein